MYNNQKYNNYNKPRYGSYAPKKPVKTFQDLDVYQQALAANVFVVNFIVCSATSLDESRRASLDESRRADVAPASGSKSLGDKKKISAKGRSSTLDNVGIGTADNIREVILDILANCSCSIPHQIAEAHSFRFGSQKECLILLEKVMLNCNKMVVYLDQTRDICNTGVEVEKFEELQKKYLFIRRKVLNLQRSWQKYMNMPKEEKMMRDF